LVLPRAFGFSRASGGAFVEHRTDGAPLGSAFVGELTPLQTTAFERSSQALEREPHCCMLTLPCGFGKTVVALRVAHAIGRRTLVVVHKEFLLSQWSARISQFLPEARVAIVQGNKAIPPEADFVLAMLQTLCLRLVDPTSRASEIVTTCGLAVIDEAHHMAAKYFSKLFFHLPVKRLLGLTATPNRKDGCTKALHMFMGQHSFLVENSDLQRARPTVQIVSYISPQKITSDLSSGQVQKLKTTITQDDLRNRLLCDIVLRLATQERQIICLSDRTAHLACLLRLFEEHGGAVYKPALYIGGQKRSDRERIERECGVLFGTFAMAQEGLDIPRLDTLVLASPASDITQAVGRILRPCSSKKPPLIIDVQDDACNTFRRQNQTRQRFYAKHGIQNEQEAERPRSEARSENEPLRTKRARCE
jgi:superfamily II DNA or RNA helicase